MKDGKGIEAREIEDAVNTYIHIGIPLTNEELAAISVLRSLARQFLAVGKEVPGEKQVVYTTKQTSVDIKSGKVLEETTHTRYSEFESGFNSARSQFIPLLMERDREIEELNGKIKKLTVLDEMPKAHIEDLESQLASAQERIEKLEMERDYEQDKRMEAQEKIKELEKEIEELVKARPVQVSFSDEAGKVLFKQMKEELASAKERIQDLSDLLEQHRQQYATKCEEAIKLEAIAERVRDVEGIVDTLILKDDSAMVDLLVTNFGKENALLRIKLIAQAIKQWMLGEVGKE